MAVLRWATQTRCYWRRDRARGGRAVDAGGRRAADYREPAGMHSPMVNAVDEPGRPAQQSSDRFVGERVGPGVDERLQVDEQLRAERFALCSERREVGLRGLGDRQQGEGIVVRGDRCRRVEDRYCIGRREVGEQRGRGGDLLVEFVEVHRRDVVLRGVVTGVGRVGEEHGGYAVGDEVDVVAATLAEDHAQQRSVERRRACGCRHRVDKRRPAGLGSDGDRAVGDRWQEIGSLDVEVDVRHGLFQGDDRVGRVVLRTEQPILLRVPQRNDDRPARRTGRRHVAGRNDRRRYTGRVVGRAVANVVGRVAGPTLGADVVVVRPDDDVFVGEVGARDDGDDVGAVGKLLQIAVDAVTVERRLGELRELAVQELLRGDRTVREVVAPGELVGRQHLDDAARGRGAPRHPRRTPRPPGRSPPVQNRPARNRPARCRPVRCRPARSSTGSESTGSVRGVQDRSGGHVRPFGGRVGVGRARRGRDGEPADQADQDSMHGRMLPRARPSAKPFGLL